MEHRFATLLLLVIPLFSSAKPALATSAAHCSSAASDGGVVDLTHYLNELVEERQAAQTNPVRPRGESLRGSPGRPASGVTQGERPSNAHLDLRADETAAPHRDSTTHKPASESATSSKGARDSRALSRDEDQALDLAAYPNLSAEWIRVRPPENYKNPQQFLGGFYSKNGQHARIVPFEFSSQSEIVTNQGGLKSVWQDIDHPDQIIKVLRVDKLSPEEIEQHVNAELTIMRKLGHDGELLPHLLSSKKELEAGIFRYELIDGPRLDAFIRQYREQFAAGKFPEITKILDALEARQPEFLKIRLSYDAAIQQGTKKKAKVVGLDIKPNNFALKGSTVPCKDCIPVNYVMMENGHRKPVTYYVNPHRPWLYFFDP